MATTLDDRRRRWYWMDRGCFDTRETWIEVSAWATNAVVGLTGYGQQLDGLRTLAHMMIP